MRDDSGKITDEMKEKAETAHNLSIEAHNALKDANQILMQIWKEVKQLSPDAELPEDNSTEVEVVED